MRVKKYAKEKQTPKEQPQRFCHDCGKPTSDYRCPKCRAKWKKKHGVTESNDNFAHDVYGVAAY